MRAKKLTVGLILATAIMLTGCSGGAEEPTTKKPATETGSSQEETSAPASDCPELSEGATIEGSALGGCVAEAMGSSAGYAAKTTVLGMESLAKFNPESGDLESTSPAGSVVVIGDQSWVKSATSDWQAADASSSDPVIAGLSSVAADAASLDPATAAAALSGELTVTGTGTRLGEEVFLVSGTIEQQGVQADVVYEITSDYVVLASTSSATVADQTVEVVLEITEWDVKQEIVAPM